MTTPSTTGHFASNTTDAAAVTATGTNGATGVSATSDSGTALYASSNTGNALQAATGNEGYTAILAISSNQIGVHAVGGGATATGTGHTGKIFLPPSSLQAAIFAEGGPGTGVVAASTSGIGVNAQSQGGNAVQAESASSTASGVWGNNTGGGTGVAGSANTPDGQPGIVGTGVAGSSNANGTGVSGTSVGGIGIHGSGALLAGKFDGNVQVNGNHIVTGTVTVTEDIVLTNAADCAEEFEVESPAGPEPGTVMVIGNDQALHPSSQPYDCRVAGVVSGGGEYKSALVLDRRPSSRSRTPVALVGKVYCKVDARDQPVKVGDLLTTSPTAGHAMAASDRQRAFGAVLGKALQPLPGGQGLIAILVALQ
jgi:hypothetical protein